MITFLGKAFPIKKHRIVQGIVYGALLCALNLLSPMLESVEISIWEARLLFLFWICMAAGFLWAGKLFLKLEIVGWTIIGYTALGAILAVLSIDRFGKVLLTGLCGFAVYIVVYYTIQKYYHNGEA